MKIKILKIEPGKKPEIKEIEDGLKSLQDEVQGDIEAVYPFDDNVGIICNEDKFRLPDGGKIKVNYPDGDSVELTCRYIDPYHLETSGPGSSSSSLWHICEFAERMEKFNETIEPVTEPMNILDVRYYCPLTMAVYERNEYGDLDDTDCTYDGRYALQYEDVISEALEREHSYDGCDEKSMATYQDNPKIRSVRFDVEDVRGTLYGCIRVRR